MTQGETLFYLREIHSHWCTSKVSSDKLAELAAANLIEIGGAATHAVRLTKVGARRKYDGRPTTPTGSISLMQKSKPMFRVRRRQTSIRAKPLV